MTPKEFLEQLNPNSKVFDLSVDYEYTEEQLLLFAKLYHESELKKLRVGDVSSSLDLQELERKLDEQLDKETCESLKEWLRKQRQ